MKKISFVFLLAVLAGITFSQDNDKPEYRMKTYYFVFLMTGTNTSNDTDDINKAFTGHMANIQAMADAGKLKLAGPFIKGGEYRGIFIIDAVSEEEVNELLSHDPAISAGFLKPQIKQWYGPEGLKVEKSN